MARRRSTITPARDFAAELRPIKSLELENRVARLEMLVEQVREMQNVTSKRLFALQARLDHIASRLGIL